MNLQKGEFFDGIFRQTIFFSRRRRCDTIEPHRGLMLARDSPFKAFETFIVVCEVAWVVKAEKSIPTPAAVSAKKCHAVKSWNTKFSHFSHNLWLQILLSLRVACIAVVGWGIQDVSIHKKTLLTFYQNHKYNQNWLQTLRMWPNDKDIIPYVAHFQEEQNLKNCPCQIVYSHLKPGTRSF